jgi:hypothetical protein
MGRVIMRKHNWAEKLNLFLKQDFAFDWATCNCALFAADAVEAMTGVDFAVDYRGLKTKKSIVKKLKKDFGDVESGATALLGKPLSPKFARRGDVVSYDFSEGAALGICNGKQSYFVAEDKGLISIPTVETRKTWHI